MNERQITEILNRLKEKPKPSPPPSNSVQMDGRQLWVCSILLVLAVVLFYLPLLKNEFVNWDDSEFILKNINIRYLNFQAIQWMFTNKFTYWMPLTWFSWALNFWMGGLNPQVYHLTNLFLHASNTVLVFLICLRLLALAQNKPEILKDRNVQDFVIPTALMTALVFGLHPIHVESVAWATERKDVLYAFFYLSGIFFYLGNTSNPANKNLRLYVCFGLYLFSLMSKPMAVTLPLVFLILDYWPLKRFLGEFSKVVTEKIPFFVLAFMIGVFSVLSAKDTLSTNAGTPTALWVMNAFRSLVYYPCKILVPLDLVPLVPFPHTMGIVYEMENILAAFSAVLITLGCFLYRKKWPFLGAAWLYYLVTLAPVVGFFKTGTQAAADRFTYLSTLSLFLLFAVGVAFLLSNRRMIFRIFLLILTGALGYGTIKQLEIWRNSQTLWESVVRVYPDDAAVAYSYLGGTYTEAKRWDDALTAFNRALSISPSLAKAHQGLGRLLFYTGKLNEAIPEFKTAISLDPKDVLLYQNLWNVYEGLGKHEEAITEMQEAIQLDPNNELNYSNLGISYSFLKKYPEAQAAFQKAYDLEPDKPQNLLYLATVHLWQGHLDEATDLYRKGIEQNPRAAVYYLKLSEIYIEKKMLPEAMEMLHAASDLNPQDPTLIQEMKTDYQKIGQKAPEQ